MSVYQAVENVRIIPRVDVSLVFFWLTESYCKCMLSFTFTSVLVSIFCRILPTI